jgi:hypothetical protein
MLASRGLALACIGRLDEAMQFGDSALTATSAIETRVLVPAIRAVVAVKSRVASMSGAVAVMLEKHSLVAPLMCL